MKTVSIILLIAVTVLAACGAATPTAAPAIAEPAAIPATATAQPVATTPPQPTATLASRCQPAPAILLDSIAEGLTVNGGGGLRNGWTVRSDDFEKAHFVAAEITGEGMTGTIGLWVTNDPASPGALFSVNAFAKEFSDWADGGSTDAAFNQANDGAREAIACAGG